MLDEILARIKMHVRKLGPLLDLDSIRELQSAKESAGDGERRRRPLERPAASLARKFPETVSIAPYRPTCRSAVGLPETGRAGRLSHQRWSVIRPAELTLY
jgi:hypothetical protein